MYLLTFHAPGMQVGPQGYLGLYSIEAAPLGLWGVNCLAQGQTVMTQQERPGFVPELSQLRVRCETN